MTTIESYSPGDMTESIHLKIVRVDVKGENRIVTVVDKAKCFTTLAFWSFDAYLADKLIVGRNYHFSKLKTKPKWAPAGQPIPSGCQFVFDSQSSEIEGFEIKRPEPAVKELSIIGAERYLDGSPVMQNAKEAILKPGQTKLLETTAALPDKINIPFNLKFQPLLTTFEAGLFVLDVPIPNVPGKLFVPVRNLSSSLCKVPVKCHLATLFLIPKPRIKFSSMEVDLDNFSDDNSQKTHQTEEIHDSDSNADSDPYAFHDSDDDQKRAIKGQNFMEDVIPIKSHPTTSQKAPRKSLGGTKRKPKNESDLQIKKSKN